MSIADLTYPSPERPWGGQYSLEILTRTVKDKTDIPVDHSSNEKIVFSDVPEIFTYSKNAIYKEEVILGRSEPLRAYSHSTPRVVQFKAMLIAMGKPSENAGAYVGQGLSILGRLQPPAAPYLGVTGNAFSELYNSDKDRAAVVSSVINEVHTKVAKLEALVYPQYDLSGITYPPPKVRLNFGPNFTAEGIITAVSVSFYGPYEVDTFFAYNANVEMSFEEVSRKLPGYNDVRNRSEGLTLQDKRPGLGERLGMDSVSLARSKFGL